ncbi:hypothetical protein FKM82_017644 [Ascaphus truei]
MVEKCGRKQWIRICIYLVFGKHRHGILQLSSDKNEFQDISFQYYISPSCDGRLRKNVKWKSVLKEYTGPLFWISRGELGKYKSSGNGIWVGV